MKNSRFSDKFKASLLFFLIALSSIAQAEEKTVVGLITLLAVGSTSNPAAPQVGIAIKPALQECFYGIMSIPSTDSGYGKMVISAAIAAQAGGNAVSITYDNADGCKIKQFVVLTP